jgi:competence protein ComEC
VVVAAFGAGLVTGLAHFLVPVSLLVAGAATWRYRATDRILIPLGFLLGLGEGALASHLQPERCLSNPLAVVGVLHRCAGPPANSGPQGSLRDWLQATSERLYGDRAPVVDALVLGLRTRMDPSLKDAFTRSGLVHLLSISGFHVGLIVAWLVLLLRLARLSRSRAMTVGAIAGVAYVAFLGWPAPASRAAAMACLGALCLARQRRVQATPLLAVTCLLVLLLDPWAVLDLGGWLSATALWGATVFSRWGQQAAGRHMVWRTFCASVGATVATAPITAAAFGSLALAGILLNFAAIPLAAIAVPGIAASLLAAVVFPPASEAFAAGSGLALAGLERLALAGARLPGGVVTLPEGWPGAVAGAVCLGLAGWVISGRATTVVASRRVGLLLAAGWLPLTVMDWRSRADGDGLLSLFFLPVGQGDGAAIRTPGGRWVLVDAGPADGSRDAGRDVVVPFLRRRGVREVSLLVVSHAHADHLGGAGAVLDAIPAQVAAEPGWPVADSLYRAFLGQLAEQGTRWVPARRGTTWELDGVRLRVVHPDTSWARWGEDLNEDSAVLLLEYRGFRALLAGDAGLPVEHHLRGRVGPVDVLKVGHHGSRSATGGGWLAEVRPAVAVLSVGRNRYGHPHPAVVERLDSAGVTHWRTDRDGAVTVRTDGCRVSVLSRRDAYHFDVRGTTCQAVRPSPPSRHSSSSRSAPSRRLPAS